ncbi:hypothetical protein [Parabacteroides gordonii]|uniref:hypothetical protein n=1 Tax=Parabacteroides gordonii TaxID=574930 RepID=UPI0026F2E777|nr:hypothetical protein [Parabacteroides gordonii]
MKKSKFLAFAALGLLTLASCSDSNDPIVEGGEQETGEQIIVLDMQDTDVLSTKSRPLYSTSNKGAEQVTDVQLLVFGIKPDKDEYEFVKKLPAITNWNNSSDDYNYGRKKEIKLTGNDKLNKTYSKYIILAVGQDESDLNSIPAPFKIELGTNEGDDKYVKELATDTWTAGATWNVASTPGNGFWQTAAINYNVTTDKDRDRVGEIFSGVSTPIEFTADGGFSTTVLLKRQVAGVLGYFNRIPASVTLGTEKKIVTGIRLVSSNRNESLDLSTTLATQEDDATHGQPGYQKTEYVVNGFNTASTTNSPDAKFGTGVVTASQEDAYIVYEIDLKDWFKWDETKEQSKGDWHDDALLPADEGSDSNVRLLGNVKGWHNALDASNSTITVTDGAVLAGEFVIPFNENGKNTFELQLINTTTSQDTKTVTVLKSWNVKLDPLSQSDKDSDKVYNIYRNHLYQVGKRGSGDNPTDPGTDPDKPQPLDKDQELIIKINDQWEFIHDMEIE